MNPERSAGDQNGYSFVICILNLKKINKLLNLQPHRALTGFHAYADPLSCVEVLVFVKGGKHEIENLEKNPRSKAKTNNREVNPQMPPGGNRTRVTLVEAR